MTDRRSTDRLLAAWLELEAPASAPDELRTDIHRATARIRPRPAWLARLGGHHMDVISGGAGRRDTRLLPLLALLGLLLAAALAAAWVGSRPPNDLAVIATASPIATPAATEDGEPTPAFVAMSDLALSMPYPIRQVQPGNLVGIAGPDTNELLRSIHRVNPSNNSRSVVIEEIPVDPSDHTAFAAWGNSIVIGHDEGNRALTYDARSGELLGETPVGTRPLEPLVAGEAIWFPNFGDGSVTAIDPVTGAVIATIPIAQFGGQGPLSMAVGEHGNNLWAVSPSSNALVGIGAQSRTVELVATLPAGSYCGVGSFGHRYWVATCDGSGTVMSIPDTYVASREADVIEVARGAVAPVFEHSGWVWFPTEDRSNPQWTTTLVPVGVGSLEVGTPVDLGARVGVVRFGDGVAIISGTDLYRLRLDALPSN